MAAGIKFYRQRGIELLQDSEGTEQLTRDLNDLFDSLNTSNPTNKLKLGDSKHEVNKLSI
jgi:non-receptor tyrosine kinase TNP-like protein